VQDIEGRRVGRVLVTVVPERGEEPADPPTEGSEEHVVERHKPLEVNPGDPAVGAGAIDAAAASPDGR
jgi:hypothetical protein